MFLVFLVFLVSLPVFPVCVWFVLHEGFGFEAVFLRFCFLLLTAFCLLHFVFLIDLSIVIKAHLLPASGVSPFYAYIILIV